ncbi:unnamed protein product [Amaranthus hypochondriacus]
MSDPEYSRIDDLKSFDESKSGVQGLIQSGTATVPTIFIRSTEDRSKDFDVCDENISVPVIDLANFRENDDDRKTEVAKQMVSASKEWGFFQIVNHGIPLETLDKMIECGRMFHEQHPEAKIKYYSRDFSKAFSYVSNHDLYKSNSANWRDNFYFNTTFSGKMDPQHLPSICKDSVLEYVNQILKLCDRVLMLLSIGLGLKPETLGELEIKKGWNLGCNFYPACPEPELTLGAHGHADTNFLTILLQDQIGGLQVLHQNKWVNVNPIYGAFIVNIGDAFQMVSNDQLKSVYHRVIAKNVGPRISLPLFFNGLFSSKKIYGPIKELISEENPAIYKDFTIEEMMTYFFSKSLDDLGIEHFKLNSIS